MSKTVLIIKKQEESCRIMLPSYLENFKADCENTYDESMCTWNRGACPLEEKENGGGVGAGISTHMRVCAD